MMNHTYNTTCKTKERQRKINRVAFPRIFSRALRGDSAESGCGSKSNELCTSVQITRTHGWQGAIKSIDLARPLLAARELGRRLCHPISRVVAIERTNLPRTCARVASRTLEESFKRESETGEFRELCPFDGRKEGTCRVESERIRSWHDVAASFTVLLFVDDSRSIDRQRAVKLFLRSTHNKYRNGIVND